MGQLKAGILPPDVDTIASPVIVLTSGSNRMDKTIESFFYENSIIFNFALSSSFARMIEESRRLAKSTEQLVAPILAIA